ncbi:MAG TPA: DUF3857 domain-containing protein [Candidatus Polarisedimenticolia bacterium]|nr:DUF3857 domain-containing protein [Candidatus Polarisedimenticolia bacterium]
MLILMPAFAHAGAWTAVTPEDLALKQGRVDPKSDAEAVEWEIGVSDEWTGEIIKSSEQQRLLVKIFNARGQDAYRRVDIPWSKGTNVIDVSARTIRPDGSVVEVKEDAIMQRTIVKGGGLKERVYSIAMPGLEPGCLVEYRWTEVRYDALSHNVRIPLQLEVPVQTLSFSIHPLTVPVGGLQMRIRVFNMRMPSFEDAEGGFHKTVISNIPAFEREPHMPPNLSVRPWMAIFYETDDQPGVGEYWRKYGKTAYSATSRDYRVTGDIKKIAQTVTAGATEPEQILERVLTFCHTQLRNSDVSDSGLAPADRAWLKSDHSAADCIKRKLADADGVLSVFLALASASGLEARLGFLPDRSVTRFSSSVPTYYLLTRACAAVRLQGTWRAVDPAQPDLPAGMLPWYLQGEEMLVVDPKDPVFVSTPIAPPQESLEARSARLRLTPEGDVEGDVTIELTGQTGALWRARMRDHSVVEREKTVTERMQKRLNDAELSNIQFDPGGGPADPFRIQYHIKARGYAARTGQRLIFAPGFFQRGDEAVFTSRERRYPVSFDYAWSERDVVTIDLPPGFHFESLPELKPIVLPSLGGHSIKLKLSEDGHQLQLIRSEIFGEGGMLTFPTDQYGKLKEAFDAMQAQDLGQLSLALDEPSPR